ncbi:MAG: DUF4870 domain-containing protein [Acidimicrobiia bacterium]
MTLSNNPQEPVEPIEPPDPVDVPSDSRAWAAAAQLLPLIGFYIFGALIIWLIKRDEDAFVEEHSREALNFQLSIFIYMIISAVLILVLIGILLFTAVAVFSLVMSIIAGVKAASGQEFRYPLTIRFVSKKV